MRDVDSEGDFTFAAIISANRKSERERKRQWLDDQSSSNQMINILIGKRNPHAISI